MRAPPATRAGQGAISEAEQLAEVAREAAFAGASRAVAWTRQRSRLYVEEKQASDDLVSQADRETELAIRKELALRRAQDAVVGEEGPPSEGSTGIRWFVDPIDGTTDYLYDRPDWAVSVAAVRAEDDQILAGCVVEPALNIVTVAWLGGGTWSEGRRESISGQEDLSRSLVDVNLGRPAQRPLAAKMIGALVPKVRDIRRGGSAACALARVATGRSDAYWGPGLQPWDGAAGMLLVSEAGGTVGDLAGASEAIWPRSGNLLVANRATWDALRVALQEVYGTDGQECHPPGFPRQAPTSSTRHTAPCWKPTA